MSSNFTSYFNVKEVYKLTKLNIMYVHRANNYFFIKNMNLIFQFRIAFVFSDKKTAWSDTEFETREILIIKKETKLSFSANFSNENHGYMKRAILIFNLTSIKTWTLHRFSQAKIDFNQDRNQNWISNNIFLIKTFSSVTFHLRLIMSCIYNTSVKFWILVQYFYCFCVENDR